MFFHASKRLTSAELRRFSHNARGNVNLMFALLLVPLVVLTITALDYGHANSTRRQLQLALDAGLGFAANSLGSDDQEVKSAFHQAFKANLPPELRATPVSLVVNREEGKLAASANTHVAANLAGYLRDNRIEIAASSEYRIPRPPTMGEAIKRLQRDGRRHAADPQTLRQEEQSRLRETLQRHFPQLERFASEDFGEPQIDQAEAERLARRILEQLSR